MIGNMMGADRQGQLDTFMVKAVMLAQNAEIYRQVYGKVDTVCPSGGLTVNHRKYLIQMYTGDLLGNMALNGTTISGLPDRNYYTETAGSGYSEGAPSDSLVFDTVTFEAGDPLPKVCEVETLYQNGSSYNLGAIYIHYYDLPKKSSDNKYVEFGLQSLILTAINTILLSSNTKGKEILSKIMSTSSIDSLVSSLSSNPPETITRDNLMEELTARTYINSCLALPMSLIDTLIDARDMVNSEISNWEQQTELEKIQKILSFKNFNRLLGDALNYASSGPYNGSGVIKRNDQKYLDYDDDGGIPALVNHRHYDFTNSLLLETYPVEKGEYYLSRELVHLLTVYFVNGK